MPCDQPIGELRDRRESRDARIGRQWPASSGSLGERAKDRMRSLEDFAGREDELDRPAKGLGTDLGKARRDFLGGGVLDGVAGLAFPAADPPPAETAVAVEDQERFRRRRGDPRGLGHLPLSLRPRRGAEADAHRSLGTRARTPRRDVPAAGRFRTRGRAAGGTQRRATEAVCSGIGR